ncbi:MAG TPA: heavy metal-responsive transcriptional regulator [Pyrinomonadaceae bacterium]|nr:heavy metal-responsive transcriptional regulator [Pyrinomonadaceae bacterium]
MSRTAKPKGETRELSGGRDLRIGEVARESGLSVETLRFYERRGLLGRPGRTPSGYRVYTREAVERLAFIRRAQLIGFSLDEIQQILSERDEGRTPCRAVREMARRKLDELDARLRELRRHRRELSDLLDDWGEREDDPGHFCGLIESSSMSAGESGVGTDTRWRRARGKGVKR